MKLFKPFLEEIPAVLLESSVDNEYDDLESIVEYQGKLSPCESEIIAQYMSNCTVLEEWLSNRSSPIDKNDSIRSCDWTDGVYYWDELTRHCIQKYRIRLPNDFKKHVHQQIKNQSVTKLVLAEDEVEEIYKSVSDNSKSRIFDTSYIVSDDYSELFSDSLVIPVEYSRLRSRLYDGSYVKGEAIALNGDYELNLLVDRHVLIKLLDESGLQLSDHKYPYKKPFVYRMNY